KETRSMEYFAGLDDTHNGSQGVNGPMVGLLSRPGGLPALSGLRRPLRPASSGRSFATNPACQDLNAMGFYQNQVVPLLTSLSMRNENLAAYRQRVVPEATGRVLEIGIGSGLNLPLYSPKIVQQVTQCPLQSQHPMLVLYAGLPKWSHRGGQ